MYRTLVSKQYTETLRKLRRPYTVELSRLLTRKVRKWRLGCERLPFESKSPARVKEGILNGSLLFLVFAAVCEDSRTDRKALLSVHSRKARQISKCHGLGEWFAGRRSSPPDSSGSGGERSGQLLEKCRPVRQHDIFASYKFESVAGRR